VSWIRRSDLKILTIGDLVYTKDQRFSPIHRKHGSSSSSEDGEIEEDVWILKVTNTKVEDSGDYECQLSYHEDREKKLKMIFSMKVLGKEKDETSNI
jgi:hypothetical protein